MHKEFIDPDLSSAMWALDVLCQFRVAQCARCQQSARFTPAYVLGTEAVIRCLVCRHLHVCSMIAPWDWL